MGKLLNLIISKHNVVVLALLLPLLACAQKSDQNFLEDIILAPFKALGTYLSKVYTAMQDTKLTYAEHQKYQEACPGSDNASMIVCNEYLNKIEEARMNNHYRLALVVAKRHDVDRDSLRQ